MLLLVVLQSVIFCNAQNVVNISGKILNPEQSEGIYLRTQVLKRVKVLDDHTYSIELDVPVLPVKIAFSGIDRKTGKITDVTPDLWIESNHVQIDLDVSGKNNYIITPKTAYQELSEEIEYAGRKERKILIAAHRNSFPALYFLYRDYYFGENKDLSFLEEIVAGLSQDYKESQYGKRLNAFLQAKKSGPVKIGDTLAPVELPDAALRPTKLIERNGKTKIICYTATGCSYSASSLSFLAELATKTDSGNYEVITIWEDESYEIWQNDKPEMKRFINWTNVWDHYQFVRAYLEIDTTPTFFIVDQNGVLLKKMEGISARNKKALLKLCGI